MLRPQSELLREQARGIRDNIEKMQGHLAEVESRAEAEERLERLYKAAPALLERAKELLGLRNTPMPDADFIHALDALQFAVDQAEAK